MTRGCCLQIESQNQLHGGVICSTQSVCASILVVAGGRQSRSTTAASVVRASNQPGRPTDTARPSVCWTFRRSSARRGRTRTRVKQTLSPTARCSLRSWVRTRSRSHSRQPAARPQIYTRAQFIPVDGSNWKRTRRKRTRSVLLWRRLVINFNIGGVKFCGTSCKKCIQHVAEKIVAKNYC
jgi:hypothetical protein